MPGLALGRLEPFVLNRLVYSQFARRGCTYRASLERCRGGARFASRRCRDWRASPWRPRCRRPSVSVDGLPCDQRAVRRRGPLGCGSRIRLRSIPPIPSRTGPPISRLGPLDVDRVEMPARIARGGWWRESRVGAFLVRGMGETAAGGHGRRSGGARVETAREPGRERSRLQIYNAL